ARPLVRGPHRHARARDRRRGSPVRGARPRRLLGDAATPEGARAGGGSSPGGDAEREEAPGSRGSATPGGGREGRGRASRDDRVALARPEGARGGARRSRDIPQRREGAHARGAPRGALPRDRRADGRVGSRPAEARGLRVIVSKTPETASILAVGSELLGTTRVDTNSLYLTG